MIVDSVDGDLIAAYWIRIAADADIEMVGIDSDLVDAMPGDFVPLASPAAPVTVFVVTSGDYDDLRVEAVFAQRAAADAFAARLGGEPWGRSEEFEVIA